VKDMLSLAPGGEIAGKDSKFGVKRLKEAIERVGVETSLHSRHHPAVRQRCGMVARPERGPTFS
jgi:hypothetical protein